MKKLFCALTVALMLMVANSTQALAHSGMMGPGWAMPPSMPASPAFPNYEGPVVNKDAHRVACASWGYTPVSCMAGGFIRHAQLVDQHSETKCIKGKNWGWARDFVWVKDGCRATFRVEISNNH